MTVEVGQSTANDGAIFMGVEAGSGIYGSGVDSAYAMGSGNLAGCSMEQIYSPITINKDYESLPPGFLEPFTFDTGLFNDGKSVGPTIKELNPYFSSIFGDDGSNFIDGCDYNLVAHSPGDDLNLKKNENRKEIDIVRTQAFRGPMMLSGWGFDIGGLPVPSLADDRRSFDPNLINNRAYWKTGPVDLMWDDQRQVWCGGYQMVYGVLKEKISEAYIDSPSIFKVKVLRLSTNQGWSGANKLDNTFHEFDTDLGEEITCVSRTKDFTFAPTANEILNEDIFVICARINYEWIILSLLRQQNPIYIGRFDGIWRKDTVKDVVQIVPPTPSTLQVRVNNWFGDVGKPTSIASRCAYTLINNSYYLLSAECE